MSLSYGKVGIAPGTTTLNIGRGGSVTLVGPALAQQGHGGIGYFDARPTDFEMAKVYGYLPRRRGWISGMPGVSQDLGACCASCAGGGPCSGGLGEEVATVSDGPKLSPAQQASIAQFVMNKLALEEKTLELKERRSRRFWGAIAGMAAGTTALIAVLSYMKKD